MAVPVLKSLGAPLAVAFSAAAVAVLSLATTHAAGQRAPNASVSPANAPARYTALAVRTVGYTASGPIEIRVDRWTTDEEDNQLMVELMERGQAGMLDAMHKLPDAGRLTAPGSVGLPIEYARRSGGNGAEKVTIFTERSLGFYETSQGTPSADYRFLVIELNIGPNGEGQGSLLAAAQIGYNRALRTLIVENYESANILLQSVRRMAD